MHAAKYTRPPELAAKACTHYPGRGSQRIKSLRGLQLRTKVFRTCLRSG